MQPVILDFDASVLPLADATVVPLAHWHEAIRFGCSSRRMRELAAELAPHLPASGNIAFLGSGDFHHVSAVLIERLAGIRPLEIVVVDNHPDNMRYPFGIHCGSWVRTVARLPHVSHVHVLGITSSDVAAASLWENYWAPLWQGRLTYWCIGADFRWARRLKWRAAFKTFADAGGLLSAFRIFQQQSQTPVYLSIDKDALSAEVLHTNWDQGRLSEADLHAIVDIVRDRIVAGDVTGDVSVHRYRSIWKRWLSARDKQPSIPPDALAHWQREHHEVNERLLRKLARQGWAKTG
jgi:hypothetical protein